MSDHVVKVDPALMSQRIEQMLEEKDITRKELSINAGIGYSNLSYMLQGRRVNYMHDNLAKVADGLGVTYGWLTGKDPTAPKYKLPDVKVNAKTPELPSNNLFKNCETPEQPRVTQKAPVSAKALVEAIRLVVQEELSDIKQQLETIASQEYTIRRLK